MSDGMKEKIQKLSRETWGAHNEGLRERAVFMAEKLVMIEREECAAVADELYDKCDSCDHAFRIAARIRSRK